MPTRRSYAAIESYLFKDERFLKLNKDVRLTWLFLLGNSSRIKCPGLIEGSVITIAKFLEYPLRVSEHDKFLQAVTTAEEAVRELVKLGWLEVDLRAEMFFLPHAIDHNLPDNSNMLIRWIKTLNEFPHSPTIRRWLSRCRETITKAFGRQDARSKLISSVCSIVAAQETLDVKACEITSGFYNGYPNGYPNSLPNGLGNRLANGSYVDSNSYSYSNINRGKGASTGGRRTTTKIKKGSKPIKPDDFDSRQSKLWHLFANEKFYVPGKGEQTVWENVNDPTGLCRKLGGEGFLSIDFDLVFRLAAWSFANKRKARKDLGRFLSANFSRDQKEVKAKKMADDAAGEVRGRVPILDTSMIPPPPTEDEKSERHGAMVKAGLIDD